MTTAADVQLEASWDARESAWLHRRQEKEDWLDAQGLLGNQMYRIEFFLDPDWPRARIYCYHLDEDGRRHWNPEHVPGPHDHSICGPMVEPPRIVPLAALPPRELLEIPA